MEHLGAAALESPENGSIRRSLWRVDISAPVQRTLLDVSMV